jgi:hypothetical protein
MEGRTSSGWFSVHQSLEVMNNSSRDPMRPSFMASCMVSPRSCSVWYSEAVSKCRYPTAIASRYASFIFSGMTGDSAVPMPTTGITWPLFSVSLGICFSLVPISECCLLVWTSYYIIYAVIYIYIYIFFFSINVRYFPGE